MDSASDEEPEGTAVIEDVDEWIDEWARLQGLEEDWLDTLRPPPAPTSPAPARPKQTGRATFELRGAGAHASIVNGEYRRTPAGRITSCLPIKTTLTCSCGLLRVRAAGALAGGRMLARGDAAHSWIAKL